MERHKAKENVKVREDRDVKPKRNASYKAGGTERCIDKGQSEGQRRKAKEKVTERREQRRKAKGKVTKGSGSG